MSQERIEIPEPLQRRLLEKSEALNQARRELEDLLELTQELLQIPTGYVLYDIRQGFVRVEDMGERPENINRAVVPTVNKELTEP